MTDMTAIETDSNTRESGPTRLDRIEQIAKIFATAMIPVIIALGGWLIQTSIERDKNALQTALERDKNALDKDRIAVEYVKIAKEILTSTEKEIPIELTTWSWQVLNEVSPVKFDKDALERLIQQQKRKPVHVLPPEGPIRPNFRP